MRFKILVLSLIISSLAVAQYRWDYGGQAGASNYLGDIGGKSQSRKDFVADMKLGQTRWAISPFVRYKFNPKLSLRGQFTYQQIRGADSLSTYAPREARNLSFRNNIFELSATPQLTIYENQDLGSSYRFKMSFNFYAFAGVGIMHHNPQAYSSTYGWADLQPLHTEGVTYSLWQFVVPVGTGFYFTVKKKHRIGFEFDWRICFTDYLDDVSKGWANPKSLSAEGLYYSNRTPQLSAAVQKQILTTTKNPEYFDNFGYNAVSNPHNLRGDPSHKDTYMTATLNYSYVIRGHGSFYRSRYGSFFSKRKKKNSRKVRAKF